MSSYEALAGCYDAFTQDVEYVRWADYLTELFSKFNVQVEQILDLACGTGSLSVILAERGYEVIGVDASEDMLAVAHRTCPVHHCILQNQDRLGTAAAARL